MIEPIEFFAAGNPKGQPRPKAFARGGIASVYDPGTAEGWKSQIAMAAKEHLPAAPIEVPVLLWLAFYFPRPKAHYRSQSTAAKLAGAPPLIRHTAPIYHVSRPDADNLAKAVMDALSVLRMWRDDAQVARLTVAKMYDQGRGPGCIIEIREA